MRTIDCELIEREVTRATVSSYWDGRPESYIYARLHGSDAEVWIYDDGASLTGPTTDLRFEAPDYENGDALARAFVEATVAHVENPRSRPSDSN